MWDTTYISGENVDNYVKTNIHYVSDTMNKIMRDPIQTGFFILILVIN